MSIYGGIISVGGGGGGGGPTADWEAVTNVGGEALLTGTQFIGITNSDVTAGGLKLKEATGQLGTNPMVRFLDQAGGENAWLKVGGQHSVGFGFEAARSAVTNPGTLQKITAVGYRAGRAMVVGNADGTFIGYDAGTLATGVDNTFVGARSGDAVTTGTRNVFVGDDAGGATTEGYENVAIGSQAGAAITGAGGLYNVFIGASAGALTTSASNVFIGRRAGSNNTTGSGVYIGADAGLLNSTGADNVYIGEGTGASATSASRGTFVGEQAGASVTTGADNTLVGYRAGFGATTGAGNTFIGSATGTGNTTGNFNVAMGYQSFDENTTGGLNTVIGASAGGGITSGNENTLIGGNAGLSVTTSSRNTAVGDGALQSATTGANNISLGFQAGDNLTTGGSNIVIGYNVDAPTATSSNAMTIGNLIFGTAIDGTGTTLSTGNIGIGIVTPLYKLHVVGTGKWDVPDNTADAFNLLEGANTYIALSTSNTTETMQFGNATTNPGFNFTGTGVATHSGLVDFDAGFKMATTKEGQFYNTTDETTNYERGYARWNANVFEIGAEKLGTGTQRGLRLFGSSLEFKDDGGTKTVTIQEIGSGEMAIIAGGANLQLGTSAGQTFIVSSTRLVMIASPRINDDIPFYVGGSETYKILFETADADANYLSIVTGSSNNIIVNADINVDFGHAASTDPTLFLHSADALTTTDWLGLWCDQTGDGHVEVGGNGLILGTSGKKIGFFGVTPVARQTGWTTSNVTTDRILDANGYTGVDEIADVLCTLIEDLKTIGVISA